MFDAESNVCSRSTWNEIQKLHPKLSPLKTFSKLTTAQSTNLTNYGKLQFFLSQLEQ